MLLKHPLVVGEEQLEAEPERQDEGEPQQGAEDQHRQHGLTLGAERHVEAAGGENDYQLPKVAKMHKTKHNKNQEGK